MSSPKMTTNAAPALPKNELRRAFETAIAQIQQGEKPLSRSKTPIFVRTLTATPNNSDAEKRALTAAARALAQLWNISPTLIR
jgi:hypothetical protein